MANTAELEAALRDLAQQVTGLRADLDTERRRRQSLTQDNQFLLQQNEALVQENKLLRQKVDFLVKRYFGGSNSEQIDPHQLEMLLAGLPPAPSAVPPAVPPQPVSPPSDRTHKKPVRQPLPEHLETQRIVLEPEEVKAAPQAWRKIGEETTQELDYEPGRFIRRLYIRPKYVPLAPQKEANPGDLVLEVWKQWAEGKPVIAPLPPRLIEKGFPGPGLLAHMTVSKYADHLPLYRQAKIFQHRYGVDLSRQTLSEWVEQVAGWLKPIYESMLIHLKTVPYLQGDETVIRYLDPDLPGKAQHGYLWGLSRPGGDVVFEWATTRSHTVPFKMLEDFSGWLQCDGYEAYRTTNKARKEAGQPELKLVGCWAHVRRKFVEALEEDRRAAWFVRQIGQLYQVESRLRKGRAGPALRQARRMAEAKVVLERMGKALPLIAKKVLPKSRLGLAIDYAVDEWAKLNCYLEDGRLEIDNNLMENAIRPTALGKKNFLFIGHPQAGWRSAVIYSILGSCHRHGIDPYAYLRDVLERLPTSKMSQVAELTPGAWAKARKQAQRNLPTQAA